MAEDTAIEWADDGEFESSCNAVPLVIRLFLLHRASMGEWMAAPYANRLATASDFAARMGQGRDSDAQMRQAAIALMGCMERAYIPQLANQSAASFAALCEVDLGWRRGGG